MPRVTSFRRGAVVALAVIASLAMAGGVLAEPFIGGRPLTTAAKPVVPTLLGGQNALAQLNLSGSYKEGEETFTLRLSAEDVQNLKQYRFVLKYDDSRYGLVATSPAAMNVLAAESSDVSFASVPRARGERVVDASTRDAAGSGSGNLAEFTFRIKGPIPDLADFSIADGILVDVDGHVDPITAVHVESMAKLPATYGLDQNMPNPFNPATAIQYQLPEDGHVRLVVYNLLGQEVRTLVDERVMAGHHAVMWDGRDDSGRSLATGVYLYRLTANDYKQVKRMLLLK